MKEASLEYPDYTFMDHYGVAVPSYLPREAAREYLEGNYVHLLGASYIKYVYRP